MRKLTFLCIFALGMISLSAQQSSSVSFAGGLWAGVNKSTTFVGFVGPKFSCTFPVSEKTKLEFGVNGIPGAVLGKNPRFGLAIGSTVMLRRDNWKIKPIVGLAILKTDTWQVVYGVGFLF